MNDDFLGEANPFTRELLYIGYAQFSLIKFFLVTGGLYLLWEARDNKLSQVAGAIALSVYLFVIGSFLYNYVLY